MSQKPRYRPMPTSGPCAYVHDWRDPSRPRCVDAFAGPDAWQKAVELARTLNTADARRSGQVAA